MLGRKIKRLCRPEEIQITEFRLLEDEIARWNRKVK